METVFTILFVALCSVMGWILGDYVYLRRTIKHLSMSAKQGYINKPMYNLYDKVFYRGDTCVIEDIIFGTCSKRGIIYKYKLFSKQNFGTYIYCFESDLIENNK